MPATSVDILGPDGLLSRELPAWESRPQQLVMAAAVEEALRAGTHCIVEAPTGVGKSFAYLAPLAQYALEHQVKVVISTNTIALQEQLIQKDIPLLQKVLPGLKAVLVKGRQNYLSLRRLHLAHDGQTALFETRDDVQVLRDITAWSQTTEHGDRGDLGWDPPGQVWRLVQSDRHNCLGRRCPTYERCFFYRARAAMEDAHLLVVNHHLYFSDLSLRDQHSAILPPHEVVVFDEAHALEDVATDHLGVEVSEAQIRWFLDGLWSRRQRGLLMEDRWATAREAVDHAREANEAFWQAVGSLAVDRGEETMRLSAPDQVANPVSPALDLVGKALGEAAAGADSEDAVMELKAQMNRAVLLAGAVRAVVSQADPGQVHYANLPRGKGSISLASRPLAVDALLRERLFAETRTVVLTSATLAADDSDRFLFLRRRLGLEGGLAKRLDSPFDFERQARLILNQSPLDPNSPRYEQALAAWLVEYLNDPEGGRQGGAFVLFTSYRQLQAVHDLARPALDRNRRFVLRHGDRLGRAQMLDLFKRVGDGVLFGTSSFWEGVDVPGDALRHVIIAKLPFETPNHPVVEARHAEIEKRGGNAFAERTLPEAIIRLKQGFGRLIRNATDTGTVAILDHRLLTKAYGRWFIKALPVCRTQVVELEHYLPGGDRS